MSAVGALFAVAGIGFCGVSGAQRRESALGVCRAHGAGFLGGRYAAVVAVCTLEAASTSGGFRDVSTLCVHRSCCDARRPTERVLDADAGMSRHDGSTTIEDAKPKSVTMGIIFNFTKGTLQGFGTLINYPVKITGWTDVIVTFYGSDKGLVSQVIEESIRGTLDRMTGDMEATLASFSLKTNKPLSSISYALKCRPTQRTF